MWRWLKEKVTKRLVAAALLAQLLSILLALTGVCSEALVSKGIDLPTTQSALNYALLALVYGGILLARRRPLRAAWWKYAVLGLLDMEGNFLLVLAYQYTSLTSVTLLDAFSIPGVMLLSWLFMRARYRRGHLLGAAICLGGLAVLVGTDSTSNAGGPRPGLGDGLVIVGASLYALSNVVEEKLLGDSDRVEVLAMIGGFGLFWSVIQVLAAERQQFAATEWSSEVALPFIGFGLVLFSFYSLVPFVLLWGGAAVLNISLLTSDLWSAGARIAFFGGFEGNSLLFFFISLIGVASGITLYTYSGEVYNQEHHAPLPAGEGPRGYEKLEGSGLAGAEGDIEGHGAGAPLLQPSAVAGTRVEMAEQEV